MNRLTKAGHWLRDWRESRQLTIKQVAGLCQCSTGSISNMCHGTQKWTVTVTNALFSRMTADEAAQFGALIVQDKEKSNAKI